MVNDVSSPLGRVVVRFAVVEWFHPKRWPAYRVGVHVPRGRAVRKATWMRQAACSSHHERSMAKPRCLVGFADLSRFRILTCALRSRGPLRARAQLRGRPIPEKALVILECNEAFENTELSLWNANAQQRLVRCGFGNRYELAR